MKSNLFSYPFGQLLLVLVTFLFLQVKVVAQFNGDWTTIARKDIVACDTITKGKYTLVFINKSAETSPILISAFIDTFFKIYPLEVKQFGRNARREVTFIIDPGYKGVAAAASGIVRFNPKYFQRNPSDIDVVTHECMHIVQNYPAGAPGWITEGIADYARFKYGLNNEQAVWKLPVLRSEHHYTSSYRVTARFFNWLEKNGHKGLVKKLNSSLQKGEYSLNFWKEESGYTLEDLWSLYSTKQIVLPSS